jgi:hypothetical protein
MSERRQDGDKQTRGAGPNPVAPDVPQELAGLVAAVARYDPNAPDPRAAANVIDHARSLVAIARKQEVADRSAALASVWADLKAATTGANPSPADAKAVLALAERLQLLIS